MQTIKNLLPNTPKVTSNLAPNSAPNAPKCESCGGQKYFRYSVEQDHPYFGRVFPCPYCNKQAIDNACGLKEHERAILLDGIILKNRPATARMVAAARSFVEKPFGFFSVHGNYGNAKTTTLMAIVNEVIERGVEARYITAADILAYLREAFKDSKTSDYDRLHELAGIPVLCIDEMDKLRETEYTREIQQELINLRYRNAKYLGTVLAWNGDIDALPFPAIVSRAREFTVIHNTDTDLRPLIGESE